MQKSPFSKEEQIQIIKMFDEYCPGINEEIEGFTDVLALDKFQAMYYAMSFLKPGCSQMAILPQKTKNNHVLLARNYEFNDEMEELTLCTTKIKGKYAHIGTSMIQFGRVDGMNECGLGVSQTSKGKTTLKNNLLPDLWNAFNKSSSKIINKAEPLKYYGICENDRPTNQFGEM